MTTGVPRLGGNFGSGPYTFYQIVQTPDHLAFVSEAFHDARLIALDGHPHLSQNIRQWNGDSRGHWDGDTLVVETQNFASGSYFYGAADGLRLVERFTRTGPDTIIYQLTFTDPGTWESPWTAEIPLKRRDQSLYEFACQEGNVSMGGMLRTARLADRAAGPPLRLVLPPLTVRERATWNVPSPPPRRASIHAAAVAGIWRTDRRRARTQRP